MIYIIGPLNPAAFFSIAIITAQLDFKLKALPVNRCLTYLVVYTKLNSVGHIFHGGHSHESTGLTRSNNSIPRSINLLLKSFFIFWFKDDTSCKNSLQWGKIRHSYQAARRNLFARSGRGINQALQVSAQSAVTTRSENIARRRVRARERWRHWPHQTLTPDELGKREREREKDFLSFGSLPFPLLKGIGNSRVAVYRKGKKIYISPSWPPE